MTIKDVESQDIVPIVVQIQRNITLVPGRSYEINCNHEGGFGGARNVWFYSNDTPVSIQDEITSMPINVAFVFSVMTNNNDWKLVLHNYRETDGGGYICRGANSRLSLAIASGKRKYISI